MKTDQHDDGDWHKPRAKFEKQSQETAPHNVEYETIEVRVCVERHARDYHKNGAGKGKRKAEVKAGSNAASRNLTRPERVLYCASQFNRRLSALRFDEAEKVVHYFKRKLLYPVKRNKGDGGSLNGLHKAYVQHLLSIKRKLPEGAWKLACLNFHDARVLSLTQPAKREIVITLDGAYWGRGYDFIHDKLLDGRFTTLSFFGVKKAWVPHTIVGDDWLYEEMNLSDIAAFDYQVLLWKDEIRIQADDVEIRSDNFRADD